MIEKKQLFAQVEAFFMELFLSTDHWLHKLIEQGGLYTLALLPIMEMYKTYSYYKRNHRKYQQNTISGFNFYGNMAYHIVRTSAATAGVAIAFAGMVTTGFAVMIGGAYLQSFRHLFKSINYCARGIKAWCSGDSVEQTKCFKKSRSNLKKFIIGATIATGFVLMTFVPGLNIVGFGLAFGAFSYAVTEITYHKLLKPLWKKVFNKKSTSNPRTSSNSEATVLSSETSAPNPTEPLVMQLYRPDTEPEHDSRKRRRKRSQSIQIAISHKRRPA